MCELLTIQQQLESVRYKNPDSLFELRILLMNTASWLASQHLSNMKRNKDVIASQILLINFERMKEYYRSLECSRQEQEVCFDDVKERALSDITELYTKLEGRQSKILQIQPEEALPPFRLAK